jgi:opacity protein-like surface antigen
VIKRSLLFALLLLPVLSVSAQVAPSAASFRGSLWAGGEFSNFSPDFGPQRLNGAGFYVDLHRSPLIGVEAEGRFLRVNPYFGEHEDSYLIGPHVRFLRHGRIDPYAKILFGIGKITYPFGLGYGTYFAYAPGGGIDYHLSRKISARVEYEYQFWPTAPGAAFSDISGNHGFTPNGFSAGVAYRIF